MKDLTYRLSEVVRGLGCFFLSLLNLSALIDFKENLTKIKSYFHPHVCPLWKNM